FETYLSSQLPNIEKDYLYKYLTSYRVEHETPSNQDSECDFSDDVITFTSNLIIPMEKRLNSDFSNTTFRIDLMKHIKPMINRIENHILIKNTLLDQIKFEYSEIYSQTSAISKTLIPNISEDEIGFLTLYFAREIERNPRKIKTLISCTTGIGTSELLRVKIEKNIPEIEVIDVISSDTINSEIIKDIDLVISTVSIKNFDVIPVVVVSAMFNKNDQQKLKSLIPKLGVHYG
ncbi:PRD domain-containing protein, partial [Staphylococcus ureilyticus]|nr:PRD domain-containing protein [Staphylococcus ureilyticus]